MKSSWAWLILFSALSCYSHSNAAASEQSRQDAKLLAASCSGCHDNTQTGNQAMPSLTDLSTTEIAISLLDYRSDKRTGTIMNRIAKGYSKAQLKMLADTLGHNNP
jgi:cytochrome subunit of sulfide dehydrogenase